MLGVMHVLVNVDLCYLLHQQLEEETALQRQVIHLEKLRAQKVLGQDMLYTVHCSLLSIASCSAFKHTSDAALYVCALLSGVSPLCPSLLQEQEELHSYRARVLAELEEEKKKLESHIAEIQEGRVRAALGQLVGG